MACASAVAPLKFSWGNNTLADGGIAPGFQVSIGSPPQLFSVLPTAAWNNLWINQVAVCGTSNNKSCVNDVGGVFQQKQSSTFQSTSLASWTGWQGGLDDIHDTFFTDVLSIGDTKLTDYPMIAQQTVEGQLGRLPLGLNSTFLEFLTKSNLAPSKSYGLWVGDNSQAKPGLLTIGGYSESLFQQPYINRTTATNCPACLVVADLKYQTADGEVDLLYGTGLNIIQGKLEPSHPYISLPQQVFTNFVNATGGTKSHKNSLVEYSDSNQPTGQLVVTSVSGLETVIPADLLFGPPAFSIGDDLSTDGSSTFGLVEQYDPDTDPDYGANANIGIFGIPYLSKVYLVRDYERELIALGNVVPTASENAEVTTICPLTPDSSVSGLPADGTNGSSTTSSPSISPTALSTSTHSNTGAIVGGVIGGVAGIILILLAAFFLLRRRSKRHSQPQPQELSAYNRILHWSGSGAGMDPKDKTYKDMSDSSGTLRQSVQSDESKSPLYMQSPTYHELPTPVTAYPNGTRMSVGEELGIRNTNRTELPANVARTELPA